MLFGVTVLPDPPWQRLVALMQLAEQNGFDYGWTYDSHVLWQEPYPLLTLAAMNTERLHLGLNVTNPGTREPTVTASAFATLHDVSGGRMIMGIGRGDSARRVARGPGSTNFDFSIFKDFVLTERFRLQFRTEFFNLTNTPTFLLPSSNSPSMTCIGRAPGAACNDSNPEFGKLSSSTATGRQIQFALKLYF